MKDLGSLFKDAMKVQEKMTEMNSKFEGIEVVGSAGGGMVKVFLSGKAIVKKIAQCEIHGLAASSLIGFFAYSGAGGRGDL